MVIRASEEPAGLSSQGGEFNSRLEEMKAALRERGVAVTRKRAKLLEVLLASDRHPSVSEIHEGVRAAYPGTSLATIYNTIEILKETGQVLEIEFSASANRYDGRIPVSHPHLVCLQCEKVEDMENTATHDPLERVSQATGYDIVRLRTDITVLAPNASKLRLRREGGAYSSEKTRQSAKGTRFRITCCERSKHMSNRDDVALLAHLMRRAGFGATRDELEAMAEQGYEATVEQLLDYESKPAVDEYTLYRYHPITEVPGGAAAPGQANWLYFMVNTQRPLNEKMALFWHHVFATGNSKVDNCNHLLQQIQMFRDVGMKNYRDLLVELASNPAMIYWLDNNENHKVAPNENWGRELLELFSLGVGNYTEQDVYECSRAFTGWTISAKMPRYPYGRHPWHFEYRAEDHDETDKSFLGYTGNFNGEDIIDIILKQPACPRFITRHLYNFFVEDEPQVPAWNIEPPRNPDAIKLLSDTLVENDYDIKPVLRVLFNSDFFKDAMYKKVKNPAEVVVGTLRLTGDMSGPDPRLEAVAREPGYMGQDILDPPSVEGWHTGHEWINSGSLVKRVNFVADRISDTNLPGVKRIVERISSANGPTMTPEELVENCLDQMGPLPVSEQTRGELLSQAQSEGEVNWQDEYDDSARRTGEMLALIGATREYQFG